ncbi:MAG: methylmalonyl Co-A mutase-associated GTPase MeaB, partial [Proteobacteria bacterium]|nr:methylmalonyl Co-A mutase-associated GTPase MeaB [Pseudomonadota bacterium]
TLGGLTPAAVRMIDALDAAGFGLILLETVGTGQSEIDVAEVADVVLVVSAPGLGDGIQAIKAGLLEIADVMVVNKADREGAERTVEELKAGLALRAAPGDVEVLKTSAVSGAGVPELWAAVEMRGAERMRQGLEPRRRRRARYLIATAAAEIIAARVRRGDHSIDVLADAVLDGSLGPVAAARKVLEAAAPGRHAGQS